MGTINTKASLTPQYDQQNIMHDFSGMTVMTEEERNAFIKIHVEEQYHVPVKKGYLSKTVEKGAEEYDKKQTDLYKDGIKVASNDRKKRMKKERKKTGSKEPLRKDLQDEKGVEGKNKLKAQQKQQAKTPKDDPFKSKCGSRNGNPTAAERPGSSCQVSETAHNNFGAEVSRLLFRVADGAAMHDDYCEKYPEECSSTTAMRSIFPLTFASASGTISAVTWNEHLSEVRSQTGERIRVMEASLKRTDEAFQRFEMADEQSLQQRVDQKFVEKEQAYQSQKREAFNKFPEKFHNSSTGTEHPQSIEA